MVSLWGSKTHNDQERAEDGGHGDNAPGDHGSSSARQRYREPDERTRLLPGGGYLSPDDPAVGAEQLCWPRSELTNTQLGVSI
jgi:hypothetical protein